MALRLFYACLIGLMIFIGCGGGGGGGGGSSLSPVGPALVSGRISGTIEIDQAIASLQPSTPSIAANGRFINSLVTLEESQAFSTQADAEGKFQFDNLPEGSYHVLARITSLSGRVFKMRTGSLHISPVEPLKEAYIRFTAADVAENQIRLQIKDLSGNPLGKCKIWFWGEQFTLDQSGNYVSPLMPAGAAGALKIEPPADKELAKVEYFLPATTFTSDALAIMGFTLTTSGITNKAPIVGVSTGKNPDGSSAFLRLIGQASDPEGEPLVTTWQTNVSTFTYRAQNYADWAIPSTAASVTIYFSASEDGRQYPRLSSTAQLAINVASSGVVTFPGEILLQPVRRATDIISTATLQMPGNTIARFEANPDFPAGLTLKYQWTVDRGTITSGATSSVMLWQSPLLNLGETQIAKVTLEVSDGVGTARKELQVKITAAPLAAIELPTGEAFEPGVIEFYGRARDYLNTAIGPEYLRWYLATGTAEFVLQRTGVATFPYRFTSSGSYTVALECVDGNGVIGTGTKKISIINARPICVINLPANNAIFKSGTSVSFAGIANDYEEGLITSAAALSWNSDLDGYLGSGTALTLPGLSSGMHVINFSARDSGGAIGSTSVVVWYDMPARITFTPLDRAVVFAGRPITFVASGTDSDNTILDSTQFKWYLNGLPEIWKEGPGFTIAAGTIPAGTHRIRVEGPARYESVVSPTHTVEIGWPIASITSPANGLRFEPGAPIAFAGVPGATGTLAMQWFLNNETVSFGSGSNVIYAPVNGAHRVTYKGTDSLGFVSSSSVNLTVERVPLLAYQPVDAAYIFAGHSIVFDATCIDTDNNVIPDSRVSWYLNGASTVWKTGKTFTATQGLLAGQLAAGTNQIRLQAVGPYGTVGSISHTLNTGIQVARIDSPLNNSTFITGSTINFAGVPDSTGPIVMQWWADYGSPTAVLIGQGDTVNTSTLTDGYHPITFIGTDSTGFASRKTINISVGEFPLMDFSPAAGTAFFAGHNVTFYGVGTDTLNNQPISSNQMSWYIDGNLEDTSHSVFPLTVARINAIGSGLKQVELRGTNSINAVGNIIKGINLGVQNATISWPITDTVIPPSTPFNFTGAPDSIGPIVMEWWLDYNLPGATLLGAGATLNATIPDGLHYITYVGTDSAGIGSSSTIRVIISNSPAISFTPPDSSRLFVGRPFNLTIGGAVEPATVKWYLDGSTTVWKSGSPATVNVGDLTVGLHQIKAEGQNLLGVSSNITNNIYYGVDLAAVTAPASGSSYLVGATVNMSGTPVPTFPIAMEWLRNDGTGPILLGNTANLSDNTIPPGIQTITYLGTDSANFCSSASIQILVNNPPTITFTPPADGVSDAIIFTGKSFNLAGTGVEFIAPNPLINPATFRWYKDGSTTLWKSSSPATVNAGDLTPGWHQIDGVGTDHYGTHGTGTHDIFYGHPAASVLLPASGSTFVRGSTVNFTGSAASPTISLRWQLNGAETGITGPNYSVAPPDGWNRITYLGNDDAGNTSSGDTMVLLNDAPAMNYSPGNGSLFFAGGTISFYGVGTSSISALPVAPATMKWYLDGSALPDKTNSPATFNSGALSVGNHTLELRGTDQFGTEGSVTHAFYYGHALADISSPASGSSYNIGDTVNLTGTPGNTAPITMYWYLDYGLAGETQIGVGANLSHTFATRGIKNITYLGTDSAGLLSKKNIQIRINDAPTLTIATPINAGKYFGGQNLSVSGSGVNTLGTPLNSTSLSWYLNGAPWKTSVANFSATVADLATGTQNVRLDGVDELGTSGTVTHTIVTGFDLPVVTAPASGTLYSIGTNVPFTGTPDTSAPITLYWYLNYGQAGETQLGTGGSISYPFPTRGLKTVSYLATDSAGTLRSKTIQILINNAPNFTIATPVNSGKFFGGQTLAVSGSGLNAGGGPITTASLRWYRDGTLWKSGVNSFAASVADLGTGSLDVSLGGADEFGTFGCATYTVETGISLPTVMSPASGTRYTVGSNVAFSGAPDTNAPITMYWYLNYAQAGETQMGLGANINYPFPTRGLKTISYIATDSAGTLRTKTIQIVVNDDPNYTIVTPVNGGKYFGGQILNVSGSGLNSGGAPITTASLRWYRDGSLWKIGVANFAASIADLGTGPLDVSLGGNDELGTYGCATYTIETGINLPVVVSPASGTKYNIGANVAFTGAPDSNAPITMYWYQDYGQAGETQLGNGDTISNVFATRGLKTISYLATDSANTLRSKTIQILVNNDPTFNIATPIDTGKYFGGQTLTFSGSGLNSGGGPISAANYRWYKNGSLYKSGSTSFAATVTELSTGTLDICLGGADEFGSISYAATHTIETGISLPAIANPASGTRFAIGANVAFDGSPDTNAPITMYWYDNYGQAGEAQLGTGASINYAFPARGLKTISYLATDSANTLRTRTIQILVNNPPTFAITSPVNNGKFWGGQGLNFAGSGLNSAAAPIAAGSLKWFRGAATLRTGVDNFTATIAELPTGTHLIGLQGQDEFGTVNGATFSIEVGLTNPTITSPASGTRFDLGSTVSFTGTPDTNAPITMNWYVDYGLPGELLIGTGASINYAFPVGERGIKNITYMGTDSAGTIRLKTIQILLDNHPTISITTPIDTGKFFGGQTVSFSGSGLNSGGAPIDVATLKWFRGATNFKTGVDSFAATVAELPTGTHLIGLQGKDENGVVNGATYTIQVGLGLPVITSPASGTRFDTGSSITFTGSPDLTGLVNMEWYWVEGAAILGFGPSVTTAVLSRGWQTILYRGTDSQGTLRSSTIQVLIDELPIFTALPFISTPTKFANGPQHGLPTNYIPIHIASAGTSVIFSVVAENEISTTIPPASITWYSGATSLGSVATLTRLFEDPGSYTYSVKIEDDFKQYSAATFTFWIWDTESYHSGVLNGPTAMVNSGDTLVYVADTGNDRILKLTRKTTGLTESGDVDTIATQTLVASCTHNFVDLAISGGTIYSLGSIPLTGYRIQSWDTVSLNSQTRDYLKNDVLSDALGLSVDASAIYIADSGNDRIRKLDITNGNFYSESQSVNNPVGIKYINATNLYVAEKGQNRMLKFASDLNNTATWNSQTANNANQFVYSATTGSLYVTDPAGVKVNVIASSGALLYSFGKFGNTDNQGEFQSPYGILIVGTDIYVTDVVGNRIVRFRSGGW